MASQVLLKESEEMEIPGRMVETLREAKHNFPPVRLQPIRSLVVSVGPSAFNYTSVRIQFVASVCLMSHIFKVPRTTASMYNKCTSCIYSLSPLSQKTCLSS